MAANNPKYRDIKDAMTEPKPIPDGYRWHSQAEYDALECRHKRLAEAVREVYGMLGWQTDDEADAADLSPDDMTAHVNGICRRTLLEALGE